VSETEDPRDWDLLDAAPDSEKTDPGGHDPRPKFLGLPAIVIPGAPELSAALTGLAESVHRIETNQTMQTESFDAFRREMRGRSDGQDLEIESLKLRVKDLELETQRAHGRLNDLERRAERGRRSPQATP
jgi:hypothetical protein